jgi:hypothetical protein
MEAFNDAVPNCCGRSAASAGLDLAHQRGELAQVPTSYLPRALAKYADERGNVRLGPIPKGTPINLIANTNLELGGFFKDWRLGRLLVRTLDALKDVKREGLTSDAAAQRLMALVPDFYALNSCPDFIMDKGHPFGTDLPDADKRALIEYLKTCSEERDGPPARPDFDYIVVGSGCRRRPGGREPREGRVPGRPDRGGPGARARRLLGPGLPLLRQRRPGHVVGRLRAPLQQPGPLEARLEIPHGRGRRLLSAGGNPRRVHGTPRDDHRVRARQRLGSHRRPHRRRVVAR